MYLYYSILYIFCVLMYHFRNNNNRHVSLPLSDLECIMSKTHYLLQIQPDHWNLHRFVYDAAVKKLHIKLVAWGAWAHWIRGLW